MLTQSVRYVNIEMKRSNRRREKVPQMTGKRPARGLEEPVAMTVIARSDDLRIRNRQRVMTAIRRAGKLSRIDIARETGLSAPTVTAIASELVQGHLLTGAEAGDRPRSSRGRPKVELSVNPGAAVVVSTVFKRNTVSSSVFDYAGNIVSEHDVRSDISVLDIGELREHLGHCITEALSKAGNVSPLRRIVVGVQGTTDTQGRKLLWTPITKHRDLPIADWLEGSFGVPVRVWNDCDMIAKSLHWHEPTLFGANFAAILLSYGVGMGLFQNGEPVNGSNSSGMEFGHMTYIPGGDPCRCGKLGCIEAYAGDYAIGRRAMPASPDAGKYRAPDIDRIIEAARGGDDNASQAIILAGKALGTGLANLFALTDPIPVALVGTGAKAFEIMESPMRRALRDGSAGDLESSVEITCFPEEMPIIHSGCAISALLVVDREAVEFEPEQEIEGVA